jgi:hypothetical protein
MSMSSPLCRVMSCPSRYFDANVQFIEEDMGVMTDFELDRLCRQFPATLSSYQLDIKVCVWVCGRGCVGGWGGGGLVGPVVERLSALMCPCMCARLCIVIHHLTSLVIQQHPPRRRSTSLASWSTSAICSSDSVKREAACLSSASSRYVHGVKPREHSLHNTPNAFCIHTCLWGPFSR